MSVRLCVCTSLCCELFVFQSHPCLGNCVASTIAHTPLCSCGLQVGGYAPRYTVEWGLFDVNFRFVLTTSEHQHHHLCFGSTTADTASFVPLIHRPAHTDFSCHRPKRWLGFLCPTQSTRRARGRSKHLLKVHLGCVIHAKGWC